MRSVRLHSLLVFSALLMAAKVSYASTQFRILTGTKSQSFNNGSQNQLGGSPLGLITFMDIKATKKIYVSFGASFEMSTETLSTSGFSFYGAGMYYIYGSPNPVNASTGSMNMDFFYPYSIFLTGGIFQKQIRVRSTVSNGSSITTTENIGGPLGGVGFNYNLNPKMYVTSTLQMLMSGSSNADFSSTEIYVGLGIRL